LWRRRYLQPDHGDGGRELLGSHVHGHVRCGTVDLLAQGSQVTLNLATDGTTTGQLFVPGGDEDGGDLDADLTGTWTLSGSTVTFDQAADTFFPDVEFTAEQDRLAGEGDFGDESIRLVLTRSE
jgi:hypothetical protein